MGDKLYVFYFLAIAFAIFPLMEVIRLRRSFHHPFLTRFLQFLLVNNILFFVDLIIRYVGPGLNLVRLDQAKKLDNLFAFILIPAAAALGYLFWVFVGSLLQKRLGLMFSRLYFGYWALFLLAFVGVESLYIRTADFRPAGILMIVFDVSLFLFFSSAIVWMFLGMKNIFDPHRRNLIRGLGLIYITMFFIIFISRSSLLPLIENRFFKHLFSVFYNIPAVLYTSFHMRKYGWPLSQGIRENRQAELYRRYRISRREQDIIQGILKGQSNSEISIELHISEKTVETHVYNIYQKMGVKNRIQLMNRFNPEGNENDTL